MKINMIMLLATFVAMLSCNTESDENIIPVQIELDPLPFREGDRPATTSGVPHVQIDLGLVPDIHDEMIRRIFSVPGIVNEPSVILSWEGIWIDSDIDIINPQALISGRELGHVHDDGSLHIFLEPNRSVEAINAGWAVAHPYNVEGREGWEGFVMIYTPQTIEELNVVFQLIVEAFNYVTGQELVATDFY